MTNHEKAHLEKFRKQFKKNDLGKFRKIKKQCKWAFETINGLRHPEKNSIWERIWK